MEKDRRNVTNEQVKKRGLCTLFHYMVVALILFVMIAADATPAFADYNVTISSAVNANGMWSGAAPDVWTPTAAGANVAVTDIQTRLNAGTSVVISTAGGGSENGDIQLNNSVSWNDNSTLTLAALRNVTVNSNITATGNTAGLMLTPNTGGGGGSYYLNNGAVITLSGTNPSLTIAGNAYTVINSLGVAGSTTGTDLQGMSGNLAGYYALGSNIDASATSTWNGGDGFAPIGNDTTPFTGQFDGLNHTITNLYINRPSQDYVGLFGYTGSGSTVSNVGMVGGSVTGHWFVGGLVGWNVGTVSNSYATGSVTATDMAAGGLLGINSNPGAVTNSYATGSVQVGGNYAGGLVGMTDGTVSNCYATGNASGSGGAVGGLIGWSTATVSNSYATGNATGTYRIGGLIGENGGPVTNSYATGMVTGGSSIGGFVGYNFNGDLISNSYWDTTTSGTSTGIGGGTLTGATGLTTAQMMQMSSFLGWDIVNVGGTSAIWRIYEGNTYPLLRSFLIPLTITADNVSKTYDSFPYTSALTNPIYSVAGASTSGLLFNTSNPYNSATDVGSYTPDIYSNQQGYDISYVNALLSIIAADTIPDPFTFTDQTGVPLSTVITSNTITVAGINTAAPISIVGGQYAINGGSYTSASGTVNNGNTVTVQQTSSGTYSTTTDATLTIGGVSDTFSVITLDDTIPDPFTFIDQTNVAPSTVITSNTITISGINAATPISIVGGTYAINGGSYTSAAGTVNNGDTVTVRQTSSASYSTTTDATLTIGGISDTFSVTTVGLLTVEINPSGSGSVSGAGISCPDDCTETYDDGTALELTATPTSGYRFLNWSGGVESADNPVSVTMSSSMTITANFEYIPVGRTVCPSGCEFDTIQAAIDASGPGDTIKVAQGTYHENIAIAEAKDFTVQGGWDSTFSAMTRDPSLTIIDGDMNGDGLGDGSVFDITGQVNLTIENFTLTNGNSDFGGGIHFASPSMGEGNLTLFNNIIQNNFASHGGGVYAFTPGMSSMTLTATNNFILGNEALINGGGILVGTSGPTGSASVNLANNTITTNAADYGGGLFVMSSSGSATVTARNNILWGNEAATYGPDLYLTGSGTTVNTDHSDIGVVENDGEDPGSYTETNSISADPIFVNPALGNYRIHTDSPCRDAGTPVALGASAVGNGLPDDDFEGDGRPQGSAYDIGADEYVETTANKIKLLSCNGKEILPSGGNYQITWMAPASMVKFNLSYSLDGGATWKSIAKEVTDRHYPWTLPAPKGNKKALVKVKGFNAKSVPVGSDISDAPFTIETVKVLEPNGGETFYPPGSATITWQTNVTAAEVTTVKLSYTLNGGLTWNPIETLTVNEGTYDWTLPTVKADKTKCKVKVVLKDGSGKTVGSDVSDGFFAIQPSP